MQLTHTFNVYAPFIFLISLFLLTVAVCWRASIELLLNFTDDDAFFYLTTAAHSATGLGSTFDGINSTNGYHPLWFLLLAGLYFFLNAFHPVSPEFFFRINFIAAFCMCLYASALVVQALRPIARVNKLQNFLLFFLVLVFICIRDVGLETHITVLLLAAYIYLTAHQDTRASSCMAARALTLTGLFQRH